MASLQTEPWMHLAKPTGQQQQQQQLFLQEVHLHFAFAGVSAGTGSISSAGAVGTMANQVVAAV
jgi:hypothetical protein